MKQAFTISDQIKILSDRIETEVDRLSLDTLKGKPQTDSLVFVGNWQDAIPRSIWVDALLSAIDVRCWGIIRTQAVNGSAVMLSLNNLLKDTLGYSNATISRVIFILRLTRWISMCSTLRTESGKFRGNIYAIHDNPVSLEDAIYIDSQYIEFVKNQTRHNNKAIRTLAQSIWQVINESVQQGNSFQIASANTGIYAALNQMVSEEVLKAKKMNHSVHVYNLNVDENSHVQKLNVDTKHHVQFLNVDDEKNESIKNQQHSIHVQNLNVVPICSSRCSSSFIKNKEKEIEKTPTTNSVGISKQEKKTKIEKIENYEIKENLIYPRAFNASENKLAKMYLEKIEAELQQSFLDETAAQIKQRSKSSNPIRNPIGYLAWLCNEHGKGNTYLTSAYLKHQQQRERKQTREMKIKQQQQALTDAALNGEMITATDSIEKQNKHNQDELGNATGNRWGGINHAVRPKQNRE